MSTLYLLVDMGYLLFYRLTATLRYVSHRKDEVVGSEDATVAMFEQHLVSQLDKLKKKYGGKKGLKDAGADNLKFIFCKDEHQCDIWRMQVFPQYKANRVEADDMVRRLQGIVKDIVSRYGVILGSPGLEADDIAYLVVKRIRERDAREKIASPIIIVTSDRDYLQMKDDKVTIIDGTGKEIKSGVEGIDSQDAAKIDLWAKILMGDKSDNIPAVSKGVGKKTALDLAQDDVKRTDFIKKKGCAAEVERNRQLIDMSQIPACLVDTFYVSVDEATVF